MFRIVVVHDDGSEAPYDVNKVTISLPVKMSHDGYGSLTITEAEEDDG